MARRIDVPQTDVATTCNSNYMACEPADAKNGLSRKRRAANREGGLAASCSGDKYTHGSELPDTVFRLSHHSAKECDDSEG
ncbi:hypothetical protein MRX96_020326 [Rhipicephalus microplus]